jgi:NAD+ synthase (glutamine-hydrolysing)
MAGGFAPIKDVPKTRVFELSRWRNTQAAEVGAVPPIPQSIIDRPPSAELRSDQQDSDSLPPYDELDPLLELLVEDDASVDDCVAAGFDRDLVVRIRRLVDRAEYKRRQAPPGIRVTSKAFGRDRRVPITNGYDDA